MKKRSKGLVFIAIGICLLVCAGIWLSYNFLEDKNAGKKSAHILSLLEQDKKAILSTEKENPVLIVEGDTFCGSVVIEKLGIRLPVYDSFSDENLKSAPCRYQGSVFTDDLILSGHNYKSHFGNLTLLKKGDVVSFIDPYGTEHNYKVSSLAEVHGADVSQMLSGDWDLTLFTCTLSGKERTAIRCQRIDK